jgi:FixJ family two-component response regulator
LHAFINQSLIVDDHPSVSITILRFVQTNQKTFTVCLLDDDPSVLKGISRLLHSIGWDAETFTNPVIFLRYAEAHCPKVVVIDMWMPLMPGLEVQSKLRTICPSTRVIVLTGRDDSQIRATALRAGASAFFIKPFDVDEFLKRC